MAFSPPIATGAQCSTPLSVAILLCPCGSEQVPISQLRWRKQRVAVVMVGGLMSALGQKRTLMRVPIADIRSLTPGNLQRVCRERIAVRNFAPVETVQEPALALRRCAVGEGIRDYVALRFPLQPIIADG
jgi:hypothetical protein